MECGDASRRFRCRRKKTVSVWEVLAWRERGVVCHCGDYGTSHCTFCMIGAVTELDWWSARGPERRALTERVLGELRQRLESSSPTPDEWIAALLDTASTLGFMGVAIWLQGSDRNLHCRGFSATVPMEMFEAQTRSTTLAPGEGMPGRTFVRAAPEWIPNVIKDDNFPRLRGAIRDLVRAVVAFPVLVDGRAVLVVEMFSRSILHRDDETTALLTILGKTLGEFHGALMPLVTADPQM